MATVAPVVKKVAVVTGVSSGLGAALGRAFRARGVIVVGISRQAPPAGTVDRHFAADLCCPAARERAVREILDAYGRADVLVNNAGIGSYAAWENLSEADLRRLFEIDFFVPVALTGLLLPELVRSRGTVINISSMAAQIPVGCMGAYNAAKAALSMYSDTLRMETFGRGVRVLNVCPGRIDTGFSQRAVGDRTVPETPGRRASSADAFAARVFRAWQRGRWQLIYPWWYRLPAWAVRIVPRLGLWGNRKVWKLGDEH